MKPKTAYILIGAAKRRGKDTFANMLVEEIGKLNQPENFSARRYSFAGALRVEVQQAMQSLNAPFDVYTEDPEVKEKVIRPLLIGWGQMRRYQNPNYWIEALMKDVQAEVDRYAPEFPLPVGWAKPTQGPTPQWHIAVVSDWRFPNELAVVRSSRVPVWSIHIQRDGVPYAGPDEENNDPICQGAADFRIKNNGGLEELQKHAAYLAGHITSEYLYNE